MCGNTRRDKIRNDSISVRVGIAPIVEKMIESRLRWFGNVWGRPGDSVVRKVDLMEDNPISRGKGQRKNYRKPHLVGQGLVVDYQTKLDRTDPMQPYITHTSIILLIF